MLGGCSNRNDGLLPGGDSCANCDWHHDISSKCKDLCLLFEKIEWDEDHNQMKMVYEKMMMSQAKKI